MPNTGHIKVFERSRLLPSERADVMGNSGGASVNNLLSFDRSGYWQSSDESDGVRSIINISFGVSRTISRLIIVDTNIVDFYISFNQALLNIIDIDNTRVNTLAPYINRNSVVYLEFDPVTVNTLELMVSRTQTPNERKHIRQIIATNEIGTFLGFPEVNSFDRNNNAITHRASTGMKHIIKQARTIDSFRMRFKTYPVQEDIDLSNRLFDWEERSFTLWPCGGGYGSEHFLFPTEGWRLEDIYNVQTVSKKSSKWWRNLYKSGVQTDLRMVEVI